MKVRPSSDNRVYKSLVIHTLWEGVLVAFQDAELNWAQLAHPSDWILQCEHHWRGQPMNIDKWVLGACRLLDVPALCLSNLNSQSSIHINSLFPFLPPFLFFLFQTSTYFNIWEISVCVCMFRITNLIETQYFFLIFNSNLYSNFYSHLRKSCTHVYKIHPLASGSKLESTTTEKAEADLLFVPIH